MKRHFAVIITALTVMIGGTATATAATTVIGTVMCVTQNSVVGVWIQANSGGSGWASRTAINNYTYRYTYTLPNGGSYQVHVGCGGTPSSWATNNKSGNVTGNRNFTCYDTTSAGSMYQRCQVT